MLENCGHVSTWTRNTYARMTKDDLRCSQVLIHYYPNLVRRIIVLEMPWVMNTVWRLVKSLLPGPAQDMIKFCTKVRSKSYQNQRQIIKRFDRLSLAGKCHRVP